MRVVWLFLAGLAGLFACVPASAQTRVLHLGARAAGMGGAFTGVADDATAFYWNPAGISVGSIVSAGLYSGRETIRRGSAETVDRVTGLSLGYTFMGVAFTDVSHRPEPFDADGVRLDTFDVAISVLQSLPLDNLVLGVNAHYLRGTTYGDEPTSSQSWDLDLGVLYEIDRRVRVGLMLRHLREARFEQRGAEDIRLPRHARLGVSVALPASALVAIDVDLSTQEASTGAYREVSVGGEKGFFSDRVYARAGFRAEAGSDDGLRPAASIGAGVRMWKLRIEAAHRTGSDARDEATFVSVTLSP